MVAVLFFRIPDNRISFPIYSVPPPTHTWYHPEAHKQSESNESKARFLKETQRMFNFLRGVMEGGGVFLNLYELIGFGVTDIEWSIWRWRFVVELRTYLSSEWFEIQSVSFQSWRTILYQMEVRMLLKRYRAEI